MESGLFSAIFLIIVASLCADTRPALPSETVKWTPLVGRPKGLNKLVGLAARETPLGLARPLQLLNLLMC